MGYCITLSTCCGVEPPCTHGTAQILPAATKLNSETQAPFCGHSRSTGLCKSFAATKELRKKKSLYLKPRLDNWKPQEFTPTLNNLLNSLNLASYASVGWGVTAGFQQCSQCPWEICLQTGSVVQPTVLPKAGTYASNGRGLGQVDEIKQ